MLFDKLKSVKGR